MPTTDSRVLRTIEESRRELLDLTFRNKLLHYRRSRQNSIEVVDEHATDVYRILVVNEKPMRFVADREETYLFALMPVLAF
jgi:hypothetical protein